MMSVGGVNKLFMFTALVHLLLIMFTLYRMMLF